MIGDKISAAYQLNMVVKKHKKNAGTHTAPTLVLEHCFRTCQLPSGVNQVRSGYFCLSQINIYFTFTILS